MKSTESTESTEPAAATDWDVLSDLTGTEIDAGSRMLGASLVREISDVGKQFGEAQAVVALLHARRTDRSAQLAPFLAMKLRDLTTHLEGLAPAKEDAEGPTAPARASS